MFAKDSTNKNEFQEVREYIKEEEEENNPYFKHCILQ